MPQLGSMATATLGALIISTALAGCGQSAAPPVTRAPVVKSAILHIYPTPAGTESAAGPSQGTLWVLAGSPQTQALFPLLLGQHTIGHGLPLPAASRTVALLKNQTLAVGLATAKSGTVQWLSAPYAKVQALCPLPGPVLDATAGPHGQHLFVLYQTSTKVMAGVVPLLATKPTATWAVPSSTVSLAPGPKGAHVYTLTSAGQVTEWPVASPHPALTQFVVGQSGYSLALNPQGTLLYALKGRGPVRNIAVVSLATESVLRVLPAPAASRQILMNANGKDLYAVVGTSAYGNVQTITGLGA